MPLAGRKNSLRRLQDQGVIAFGTDSVSQRQIPGSDPQSIETFGGDRLDVFHSFWVFDQSQQQHFVVRGFDVV